MVQNFQVDLSLVQELEATNLLGLIVRYTKLIVVGVNFKRGREGYSPV